MKLDYYLIDALSPFFTGYTGAGEVNWSKIPFGALEKDGTVDNGAVLDIKQAFTAYVDTIVALGYNAITLDDLAHMVMHSFYPEDLTKKLVSYNRLYSALIAHATARGCRIFVTSDILFFNDAITAHTRNHESENIRFLCRSLSKLFKCFPEVEGVVIRFGETDGIDVTGDFHSRIMIRTPRQCRRWLKALLTVCEEFDKQLIVRTWTLGAFPVGDLMWNPRTFETVFSGLPTGNLIISQKYGETDFFRYSTMSPLLFEGHHRRIVEFQARREYEGFGEFPSFVGFDYERYARYLAASPVLCGISVWCQTGGWSHFKKLSFVKNSSPWVELNVLATIRIFRDGVSAEAAAEEFLTKFSPGANPSLFITLLRLSEKVINELWYIPEFAHQRLYFRRTRIPSLLYIFWDNIIINHTMRKILRRFVHERRESIHDGYRCLQRIRKMRAIAEQLSIDIRDIDFQYDTFQVLALAREYYFGEWTDDIPGRLQVVIARYREKYPDGFHIVDDFNPVRLKKWLIKTIFWLTLRRNPHYRFVDRVFLLNFASLVYPLFRLWEKRRFPAFARTQAMGIETLFR